MIAGSDSGAGAGIQADLKTAQAFRVYAQTAVTAVTAQDSHGVQAMLAMPPDLVRAQIAAALNDIGADAIKIGMLATGGIAAAVADALDGTNLPLVLDPVLLSSSGAALLDAEGVAILKARLIPRATLVTPNFSETEALVGIAPDGERGIREAAQVFAALGAAQILFKGGHDADGEGGAMVTDNLWQHGQMIGFASPRQTSRHTHGTGCTLATAIACGLAAGVRLADAVEGAHAFVQAAIRSAPGLGAGHGPLNHNGAAS